MFITDYLCSISPIPYQDEKSILKYRYLDAGHIDSFGIINFILAVEDKFGISLTPEDTESDEFRSIEGFVRSITKKIEKR
ncbi:MAG: hypothetical protein ABH869_01530 [Candidatus Omnitrophota bacterium]